MSRISEFLLFFTLMSAPLHFYFQIGLINLSFHSSPLGDNPHSRCSTKGPAPFITVTTYPLVSYFVDTPLNMRTSRHLCVLVHSMYVHHTLSIYSNISSSMFAFSSYNQCIRSLLLCHSTLFLWNIFLLRSIFNSLFGCPNPPSLLMAQLYIVWYGVHSSWLISLSSSESRIVSFAHAFSTRCT